MRLLRLALWLTVIFFVIFGSIALTLRTQWGQTTVVQWLAQKASDKLGFTCTIGGFYLDWVDFARVTEVRIKDPQGHTMIEVGQLKVNLKLASLLEKNINLDLVSLEQGHVQLYVDKKTGELNIVNFIDAIQNWIDDTTHSVNPSRFSIDKAKLDRMSFSYIDETEKTLPGQFDYFHFRLDGIKGEIQNFWQRSDTIGLQAIGLSARDRATGLKVHSLSTLFRFTEKDMLFQRLRAAIGDSYLRDSLAFNFESTRDFSKFNSTVQLTARLDSSVITTQDISFFAPTLKDWFETYTVSGNLNGTVDDFRLNRFKIFTGKNSFLAGNLSMKGLPEVDETFVDIRLKPSFINPGDLEAYAGKTAVEYLDMLGVFDVSGSFTGFFKNFVAKTKFRTDLGVLNTDIQMDIKEDFQATTYNGHLQTTAFDLGRLLKQKKYLQKIDIDGTVKGSGFDPKRVDLFLDAQIDRLGILNYDYTNIRTKAHLKKNLVSGFLSVKDPHLIFNGEGKINLIPGKEDVNFSAVLGRANLMPLKLTDYPLDLSSEVSMKFTGLDFDNFLGTAQIDNFRMLYKDERMDLNQVNIESHLDAGKKKFSFRSPLVDAQMEGSFKYRKFVEDAMALVDEYVRLIKNQQHWNDAPFVKSRYQEAQNYGISLDLNIKNINPLLDLLDLPIHLSPNTLVKSQVEFGVNQMLMADTHFDTLIVADNRFIDSDFDLSTVKSLERSDVIAELYVFSKKQFFGTDLNSENLVFDAVWDKGKIDFKLKGKQSGTTNLADIKGLVFFDVTGTQIRLKESRFSLAERIWKVENENEIELTDSSTLVVKNLVVSNTNQKVKVDGIVNGTEKDTLWMSAINFDLNTLMPITKTEIGGILNAHVFVSNLRNSPIFQGKVQVEDLVYEKYAFGNFSGEARWVTKLNSLLINGDLIHAGLPVLNLDGQYSPDLPEPLYVRANASQFNIDFLRILIGSSVSNLNGYASGSLLVKGTFAKPVVTGMLNVREGQVTINYLNTTYKFAHKVTFHPGEISADGVLLVDENGQVATVDRAALTHNYFEDFKVDLYGRLNNFMVFNILQRNADLYYGTAICTGNLSIQGGFDDIFIKADARTNRGTRIFIPLDAAQNEDLGESFITFVDNGKRKQNTRRDTVSKVRLSGIRMDFDLDVTDEAYGEIIFDRKAGDIIRANGTGKIRMNIDTRGEFNLIGQYVINKGDYHFTTYNLINKDFDIRPGSTITWNGPVLEGILDILAEYNLNASLAPLAAGDLQIQEKPESKRRYPVVVRMKLTEALLKPNIALGLEIKDYPKNSDLNFYVQAFQTRIATDEQELNRQVFSLMIFRSFAPEGQFTESSSISYSSFSDLVSNQLSSWLSQFDENLEVNVDISGLSQSALNNFQLRFSYTMLEGRLRLTRDGGFTNAQNQTSAMSIAGDWTLEYMLTKDGILRAKMFHRTNQNLILSGLNTNSTTQGASFLHTQSFNRLSELFGKKAKKKAPAPKKEETQQEAALLNSNDKEQK